MARPPPMVKPHSMTDREILIDLHGRLAAMDRDWFWFWRVFPALFLGGVGWLSWLTLVVIGLL